MKVQRAARISEAMRALACAGLVASLGLALAARGASAAPDPKLLHLKAGTFDPRTTAQGPAPEFRAGARAAYLVHFDHPIGGVERAALEAAGASVKGYVPMQALEVVMLPGARPAVERVPGVRWVGPYRAAYKASVGLVARQAVLAESGRVARLLVSIFPGEESEGLEQLRGLDADILRFERGRAFALAEVAVPARRLAALLDLPLVRHVQEVAQRRPLNDRQRDHTSLSDVADDTFSSGLDPSLDGYDDASGFRVKYGHTDGGMSFAHPDYQAGIVAGRITAEPGADTDDTDSGHGTHTAGSIVGDGGNWSTVPEVPPGSGAVSADRWRGVQPEAALHHISFENDYSDRETFERLVEEGAHISSNSWGYCTLSGCNSITDYDAAAAAWDDGVWDADDDAAGLQPLIVFFSAGNDGDGGFDGCGSAGSDQISTPATAKNVITVGANETDRGCNVLEDNPGDMATFSSRGPVAPDGTGQGLFKPEVTATGTRVLSAEAAGTGGKNADANHGPFSCSDTGTSYRYENGTSMSCPHAAGVGGVILQDLVVKRGVAAPTPSLVKALLVNGARALQPGGSCSYGFDTTAAEVHQGWGQVVAPDSMYGRDGTPSARSVGFENEFVSRAVATGQSRAAHLLVQAGGDLRVTLAWTDYPASPIATSPLVVNDLDLEVSGPEGLFLGNNFSGEWSVESAVSAVADRYNVVENVYLPNVQGGTYTIIVRGHQVSQDQEPGATGIEQNYSLVWSAPGPPPKCSDGIDNDGDGKIDYDGGAAAGLPPAQVTVPDVQCVDKPWKNREMPTGCGIGFELVLLALPLRRRRRRRRRELRSSVSAGRADAR